MDPDAQTREEAAYLLGRLGYRVLEAADAYDAFEVCAAAGGRVDLLLTEAAMPGLNGHELARLMAARLPDLKVVYLTDAGYARLTRRIAAARGLAFVPRPYTLDRLATAVRDALDAPRMRSTGAA